MSWSEEKWITYVSSEKVRTYVFKFRDDLVGFFELIFHPEKKETEIAYFGLLEEYQNKKLGSYLLHEAIKKSFIKNINGLIGWFGQKPNGLITYQVIK